MLDAEIDLPDFEAYKEDLYDPKIAREFLLQIIGLGYEVEELEVYGDEMDIKSLENDDVVILAQMYWPIVYLNEYPDFGELEH